MTSPPGWVVPELRDPVRTIGRRTVDFDHRIAVMAIVNRTPDSFHDRGATFALDRAVAAAVRAAEQGADWVDIGGVKFAPGPELPAADEIDRVVPVVRQLAQESDVTISVDTFRPEVAAAAIAAGASVVNDTTGLRDPRMADVVADSEATVVITHSTAEPRRPLAAPPRYDDVTASVVGFLRERVDRALAAGIPESRIVVDPGHDLNKNTVHTLELTRRLPEVVALGYPVLAAVSNKDFVGESLGRPRGERLAGSLAVATLSAVLGARIVRMHDVAESVDAMRMVEATLGWRAPVESRHNT
ncbi:MULTISPECIES: dihydropteroate synthase [unclassified Curtobacterium]|uniref:dihydropteroate synthase n=1 Tax=unclassified Curtobacterium TaxID=257496 RepID=UPI0008DC834B|nr:MULTISPECIES: dihydropteroate synthase [unclassified Curtobacterium]OIH99467.1 dihydropteroate synthase [Curtobacterium sp. MCBA15_003]OII11372.1 dihydropteroate synthase [Curtobacterium sp. MCBA15_009]OII30701.1 dihydropteroate synthase [Curtobacterium sp. MMLR14_006]